LAKIVGFEQMDVAKGSAFEPMLTTAALAAREDFRLGRAVISPSTRTITGPAGKADIEPRVMQVLVVLADAVGQVVTRDTLFGRCWGSAYVGDDSLNRAVGVVRKLAGDIAAGSFEIETISRTGYRLNILDGVKPKGDGGISAALARPTRRVLIGAGAAAAAAGGLWWAVRNPADPRFDALMVRGEEVLLSGTAAQDPNVIGLYEQAVRLEPDSAKAWGILAYLRSAGVEFAEAQEAARLIEGAESASRRALAIDPKEPNALTAMLLLQGPMLDWATRDRRLRDILAIDPRNIPTMGQLMGLLQSAGLTRESWFWNERILELAPLSRPNLIFRAMKLWILGNVPAADKVIDRVRGLWPDYKFGFFVRMSLFAFTGRPRAALAMLDSTPEAVLHPAFWRTVLVALDMPSPQTIEAAHTACLEAAKKTPQSANMAVMMLCALGKTDAAFDVARGYVLGRGRVVSANQAAGAVNDINKRMTPWLFTPPVAAMRADPRFLQLCEEFGLVAYWRARGVRPDYQFTRG